MISRYVRLILGVSIMLLIVLLVLSQIKKSVRVAVEMEASHFSFEMMNHAPNFLSVHNTYSRAYTLKVASFRSATLPYSRIESLDGEVLDSVGGIADLIPEDLDPTATFQVDKVAVSELALHPGNRIECFALKNESNRFRLDIIDFSDVVQIITQENYLTLKPKRSFILVGDEEFDEPLYASFDRNSIIEAKPLDSVISLRFQFASEESLTEDNVLSVRGLDFTEDRAGNIHSAVMGGKIHVAETDKTLDFGKNKTVIFDPEDVFEVTELTIYGDHVKVVFEGETSMLQVGHAGNSMVPSWLEYLYTNNFLMVIFNSYMVLLTFFISIRKTNLTTKKQEAEEDQLNKNKSL